MESARRSDGVAAARAHARPFGALSAEEQAEVRKKQRDKKERKQRREDEAGAALAGAPEETAQSGEITRTHITEDEYFGVCGGARFRDPRIPPTEAAIAFVLSAARPGGPLSTCQYFQFTGTEEALWAPVFNARLLHEGFFTITSATGQFRAVEPLPELQPFYSVLLWRHFEASRHVRRALGRLRGSDRRFRLVDRAAPTRSWRRVEAYHVARHGTNWLTARYFAMLRRAAELCPASFTLHAIEMFEEREGEADANAEPLAGEIGFSVGRVYTSLSGWRTPRPVPPLAMPR